MATAEVEAEARTLFRSADLLVRGVGGSSGRRCCVVTFASYTEDRTLDRPGFGEGFLRRRGIDAVHVISRDNEWYQYPETPDAMAAVRAATAGYGRVVAYGSSMGAYAALRLAGLAGAGCALALSPQYSIDPALAPFEGRWAGPAQRFRRAWEGSLPFPELEEAYVVYDPLDLDARHVALIEAEQRIVPVRLRSAGHPVTGFLQGAGLLQPLLLQVVEGRLDVPAFEREAWARRRRSVDYHIALANRTRYPRWQVALLERAARDHPGHAYVRAKLGLALGRAGRLEDALAVHRSALEIEPGGIDLMMHLVHTLREAGDLPGAVAAMEELWEASGRAPEFEPRLHELRAQAAHATADRAAAGTAAEAGPALPAPEPVHSAAGVVHGEGDAATVTTAQGEGGCALFGPYARLQPGPHEVEFRIALDQPGRPPPRRWGFPLGFRDRRVCCVVDACTGRGERVVARRPLTVSELQATAGGPVVLPFDAPAAGTYEFRVFATGAAGLRIGAHRPFRRA